MDDEGIVPPPSTEPKTVPQLLDEACSVYMLYGMTYDEYWNGDVEMCKHFREMYKLKQDVDFKKRNETAWIGGMYTRVALEESVEYLVGSISKMMGNKKRIKPKEFYPKKPFVFNTSKDEKPPLSREEQAIKETAVWTALLFHK